MSQVKEKWNRIYATASDALPQPCEVLQRYAHLLPRTGSALDVACGRGGNALFCAAHGLVTTAVDISDHVIDSLAATEQQLGTPLQAVAAPVEQWLHTDANRGFDVIVVSRFLDRSLVPALINTLNDNGVIFYQTFIKEKTDAMVGPSNPDYLLDSNELLSLFDGLVVRAFYDPGAIGDRQNGERNESYLVAQKAVSQ
ncbi:MAG: methyltransferase domain-containing protein [Pseudomonadota bacterium]